MGMVYVKFEDNHTTPLSLRDESLKNVSPKSDNVCLRFKTIFY